MRTGADDLCSALVSHGITHVFGIPGSQNLALYDSLRRSGIQSILTTNELAAGFMAHGFYRASGRIAPLITIPGPGFTWSLTPIAESLQDSVALLHIVGRAPGTDHRHFFQAIDQKAVAAPLVKDTFLIDDPANIFPTVAKAIDLATTGEPGPVMIEWLPSALDASTTSNAQKSVSGHDNELSLDVTEAVSALIASTRPILLVGQGAASAADALTKLAEALRSPVCSTASGRGIIPEDHPLAVCFDGERNNIDVLNELLDSCDLILVLGCKLGSAGTISFQMRLPRERIIRVDMSAENIATTSPSKLSYVDSISNFVAGVLPQISNASSKLASAWTTEEISEWAKRIRQPAPTAEPVVRGISPGTIKHFIGALRKVLPRNAIVCTDTGFHQQMIRRHFDVLAPAGLLFPSDYQSMGFGLPVAIGAKLAVPERQVIAVIGDGSFAMSGLEILTAVREGIALTVIVFNDGYLGRIRLEQLSANGWTNSVTLLNPNFEDFAGAVGARYALVEGNAETVLRKAISNAGVTIIEVRLGDSARFASVRAQAMMRKSQRGAKVLKFLRKLARWIR
ncbi:MAG: thiamine pyrophosphate-binding protein [Hyphomicrobium sp.]|uniref:thiamine pyrophosphate-binding protein n=1 Tax=Hyphomicrobium sp. TaxID=82 RepID=UPI0039E673A2